MIVIILIILLIFLLLPHKRYTGGQNRQSKSEAAIIKVFEELTKTKFPTVHPEWLIWKNKHLELDGFNGQIAIEFSGPLHTKWLSSYEPYEKYFNRLVNDRVKQKLCEKKGVKLLVVDYTLPQRHWYNYAKSRLYDINAIDYIPSVYIPAQVANPYRNEELEKKLGLSMDEIDSL